MISDRLLYWRRINLAWIIEYGPNTNPNTKCLSSYGVRPGTQNKFCRLPRIRPSSKWRNKTSSAKRFFKALQKLIIRVLKNWALNSWILVMMRHGNILINVTRISFCTVSMRNHTPSFEWEMKIIATGLLLHSLSSLPILNSTNREKSIKHETRFPSEFVLWWKTKGYCLSSNF